MSQFFVVQPYFYIFYDCYFHAVSIEQSMKFFLSRKKKFLLSFDLLWFGFCFLNKKSEDISVENYLRWNSGFNEVCALLL